MAQYTTDMNPPPFLTNPIIREVSMQFHTQVQVCCIGIGCMASRQASRAGLTCTAIALHSNKGSDSAKQSITVRILRILYVTSI